MQREKADEKKGSMQMLLAKRLYCFLAQSMCRNHCLEAVRNPQVYRSSRLQHKLATAGNSR